MIFDKLFDELFEATVIGTNHSQPLRDSDTVRVYHGTVDFDFVNSAIKHGLSGDVRADRRHSYETNNNPKGLFVTPDLRIAKNFGPIVLEFHARVRDLESPVWPSGTFTVQGGMSGTFNNQQERELERMRQRNRFSDDEMEHIRNSDRPELAAIFLSSGERQALFTGNINPNNISAIWVVPDLGIAATSQTMERMSSRDFIRKLESEGFYDSRRDEPITSNPNSRLFQSNAEKVINPRDSISAEDLIKIEQNRYGGTRADTIEDLLDNPSIVRDSVWNDAQFNRIMQELRRL